MKKGVIHLILVVVLAAAISIGTIGLVGTIRTQTINKENVLSSSIENKGQGQSYDQNKSRGNFQPQSSIKKESKSEKSTTTETGSKTKEKTNAEELEIEDQEATHEASPSIKPGRKIRTHFPITVNPLTNEKIVTTPSGTKIIILPEVAIQNMIRAGFPVVLPPEPSPTPSSSPEATPSATPEGTPSGTPALLDESGILLTEIDGKLVYEIPSIKQQKFLGLVSVKIKVKGYVSAENGAIFKIQKSLFDNILDFFSF
ncbi:hypothetical protein A3A49_00150 [Candidatus Curtissbacteria bacterium RIFCSPLOWO2_01_FULL_38_11b]|uniref:Uncharacterized protein n=1 Tax=Candidatus Curtissbacteria bacterium RIFCSPLOWO2_01_FULL_38_11b TaxID=1797725 RepID=A0A1F5H2X4_9BACT|nr:MAG: hypothetical protein A3A49_00150 [Candidatus Curtissbacteria bacterium RIFCSPLOWO2_01_FULL_38_11b]